MTNMGRITAARTQNGTCSQNTIRTRKPNRAYDRANWAKIGQAVHELMGLQPRILSSLDLDRSIE